MTPALTGTMPQEASPLSRYQQWQSLVIDWVRSDRPDLSNRQLAVLLIVTKHPGPHTVRGLAIDLNVTKAVISRALDRLGELHFLRRLPDAVDRRNIFIVTTRPGERFVKDLTKDLEN